MQEYTCDRLGKMLGEGNTAEVYAFGEGRIVKLLRPGISEPYFIKEHEAIQLLCERLDCVPRAFGLVRVEGRLGAVYQRVEGQTLLQEMTQQPWRAGRIAREMAAVQYRLHSTDTTGLPLPRLQDFIAERLAQEGNGLTPAQRQEILNRLAPLPGGNTLCHYDLHPDNLMREAKTGKVYVIDWANAGLGPAGADVARTCVVLRQGQHIAGGKTLGLLIRLLRGYFYRGYLREYTRLSGISAEDLAPWELPILAARLAENVYGEEKAAVLAEIECKLSDSWHVLGAGDEK